MRPSTRSTGFFWVKLTPIIPLITGAHLVSSCGLEESPSFIDEIRNLDVNMQVDRTSADTESQNSGYIPNESEMEQILDQLSELDGYGDSDSSKSHLDNKASADANGDNTGLTESAGSNADADLSRSDDVLGSVSKGELDLCARLTGSDVDRIHVMGNNNQQRITANSVVAAKVTGNRSSFTLNLQGDENTYVRGICIFVAGNQGSANVNVGVHLGQLLFVARGNRGSGSVHVQEGGRIDQVVSSLSGNATRLNVSGPGRFVCGESRVSGNAEGVNCQ